MTADPFIPADLSNALRSARRVAILTGAGVSAESGIPTFRDALTGLWSRFNPEDLATPEAFNRDPTRVTRWYDERRLACLTCRPNPAHLALVELEKRVTTHAATGRFTLITQNVDRLHQRAGNVNVIELHGTLMEWRCTRTGQQREYTGPAFTEYPPRSEHGGLLRPAVVWFGEMLPADAMSAAQAAARDCDLFFSIGTSTVVYPAAGLLHEARAWGARLIEINPQSTPVSSLVDWSIRARAGRFLPALLADAFDPNRHADLG